MCSLLSLLVLNILSSLNNAANYSFFSISLKSTLIYCLLFLYMPLLLFCYLDFLSFLTRARGGKYSLNMSHFFERIILLEGLRYFSRLGVFFRCELKILSTIFWLIYECLLLLGFLITFSSILLIIFLLYTFLTFTQYGLNFYFFYGYYY